MRTVKSIHKAISTPIDDLVTYNALPGDSLSLNTLNPFIFLNHHGPQVYSPNNSGLPFGPHPHRGIETVTFILDGDIKHKDSGGYESTINAGGIQWMTAGRGLIHMESSSDKFRKNGGKMEILQLWLNLPAKYKLTDPFYKGLQREEISHLAYDEGKVQVDLISGTWDGKQGAIDSVWNVLLTTIYFKDGGKIKLNAPEENNVFFYVVRGDVEVNEKTVSAFNLVLFEHDAPEINVKSSGESIIIFGHSTPLNEPIAAQGPFVMNTQQEIMDAYEDYRAGKFGVWKG